LASSHAGGLEIVKFLLAKGANLKSAVKTPAPQQGPPTGMPTDDRFRNPLAAAADTNDSALINFILDKGGPEMAAGPGGAMAIMSAATFGNSAVAKRLLAAGVNVNAQSPPETERVKNGPLGLGSFTALILAASGSDTETVRLLLEAGANVNAKDVRGMT